MVDILFFERKRPTEVKINPSPTAVLLKSAPFSVDVIEKLSSLESSINLVQSSIRIETSQIQADLNSKYTDLLKLIKDLYRDYSIKDEEKFVTESKLQTKIDHIFELLLKKKLCQELEEVGVESEVISPVTITKLHTDMMNEFAEAKKDREALKNDIIKFIEERFALILNVQDKILSFISWLKDNLIYLLIISVTVTFFYFGVASLVLQGVNTILTMAKWAREEAVD